MLKSKDTNKNTKTAHVYILTKEGNPYSEDGKQYLMNNMTDKYNIKEFIFHEGPSYNQPKMLLKALQSNSNAYVVLSEHTGITVLHDDNIDATIRALSDNLNTNAWELLTNLCHQVMNA